MKVEVKKSANKSLKKTSNANKTKIIELLIELEKLETIGEIPNDGMLKGHKNRYKIRVGNYRIIYKPESENHITITAIAHRKEIYKRIFGISL